MALVDIKGSGACPRLSPMDALENPFSLSKVISANCLYVLILPVCVLQPDITMKDLPC